MAIADTQWTNNNILANWVEKLIGLKSNIILNKYTFQHSHTHAQLQLHRDSQAA